MVNNFDLIRPLLKWEEKDSYYYIQLLFRKKDGTTKYNNKNNSARLVQAYQVYDMDRFDEIEPEIKQWCDLMGCRAGINFNLRRDYDVGKFIIKRAVDQFTSGNYNMSGIVNSANGVEQPKSKYWIVDCDSPEEAVVAEEILTSNRLRSDDKEAHKTRIITKLPTYSGVHIITRRFDSETFHKILNEEYGMKMDVQENNPAALYYPTKEQ